MRLGRRDRRGEPIHDPPSTAERLRGLLVAAAPLSITASLGGKAEVLLCVGDGLLGVGQGGGAAVVGLEVSWRGTVW
jgi:hypothetical protein